MKKLLLIAITLLLTISLSACKETEDPFKGLDGYTLLETDTISLTHSNGVTEQEIYSYTFTNEYYMFIKDDSLQNTVHYDFTNINNYKEISADFKAFLDTFDIISEDSVGGGYGDSVELSTGATEGNFNLEKVDIQDGGEDIYAYIVLRNGVQLRISYSVFKTAQETYYIPSYIIIETIDIHHSVGYNFLGVNNEYFDTKAVLIDYSTNITALPPKTGVQLDFEEEQETDLHDLGYFQRVLETDETLFGEKEVCSDIVTDNCIDKEYFSIQAQVYDSSIQEVQQFYIDYFSGTYFYEDFVFVNDGVTFYIHSMEEVTVNIDGRAVQVVNMIVEILQ